MLSANLILTFLYGDYIRLNLEWLLGTENKTILSNLFFIEGALTIGIGALIAAGYAESRMPQTRGPSAPYIVDKLSKQRSEFREKQISTGLLMILAGIPLIIMAISSSLF